MPVGTSPLVTGCLPENSATGRPGEEVHWRADVGRELTVPEQMAHSPDGGDKGDT